MEDENDEHFIFRLNDNGSGPSLLMKVCAERGWRMYQGCGDERWNLWWRTSAFPAASYKALGDWQASCKWTLKQVRRALVGRWGAVEWLVWQRVRALVTLTLLAQAAGTPPARNCFEFYGFDVLLDESMKPWLIEVNLSPALAADCEADVTVKQPMLHELFDLLGMPMRHTGLSLLQGPPTIVNRYMTNMLEVLKIQKGTSYGH
ncbi:putative tubulin polyglutamylase TTLL2 [Papilio xuthus]|uniref:Putative tubulin polyglutamylase TTLL2 n=1 Tax=Papilio xuthus TaxID=66420 RepID=A0A194PXE5_PAPXU|nr:putative tubulin polyglutamylase TTLL2 [Papilio xuthus]